MNRRALNKARWLRWTAWALCLAPFAVAAERAGNAPTTLGAGAAAESPPTPSKGNVFDRPRGDAEHQHRPNTPVTEEEWLAAREFLEQHSPHRFRIIKDIPTGEAREGLKKFLVNKWRGLVQLQTQSPELYKTRVREVELDDEVFGICVKLKHGRGDSKQLQSELNDKIAELFNLGLAERRQRIGLIEKSLVDQKKTLESDERDKARLIQQQYDIVLARGVEGARLDAPRHPGNKSKAGPTTATSPGEDRQ